MYGNSNNGIVGRSIASDAAVIVVIIASSVIALCLVLYKRKTFIFEAYNGEE